MKYLWWQDKYNTGFQNLLLSGLIGGTKDSEGNVFIDGKSVCDYNWDVNSAKVACYQFGFTKLLRAATGKCTKF